MFLKQKISDKFSDDERIVVFNGNCLNLLQTIPDESTQLVITSPPHNIGKEYERKLDIKEYVEQQTSIIRECARVLTPQGHICWQVGNYIHNGSIIPLDVLLYPVFITAGMNLRNRIIWHFEHGLHCKKRFSGRYEVVLWFTKTDDYLFNVDNVRVPQKYPGKKYFKGPKAGQYSCNPLGKNPGDVWNIPNVKSNHPEKTEHPCQFPVELVERFVLSMTNENDWVLDPFLGAGTSIIAAIRHNRKGAGAEIHEKYSELAKERILHELDGKLKTRPMDRPIYDPIRANNKLTIAPWPPQNDLIALSVHKNKA